MGEKFEPWSSTDDENVVYADYNQDMIHLLSVEDCSAITSVDLCHYAIISPFTVVHETKESSLQKSPTDSSPAQLSDDRLMIQRFLVQTPLGTIFDEIYVVLCNFRSVR